MNNVIEYMDIVDENDKVVGRTTRDDIYKNLHRHRIVHVLIFNKKGEMALQLRSRHARFCPLHWSTAVGGHVQSGETYEQAALREMEEEAGIKTKVHLAYKDVYSDITRDGLSKFLVTFTTKFDGPFSVGEQEVEAIDFFSLDKIWKMINDGEKFHPELLYLLNKHYKN